MNRGAHATTHATDIAEVHDSASVFPGDAGQEVPAPGPQIALLTPYTGGNLGDAAIQDALIANLRLRLPAAQFSGICLNGDNFVERHGRGFFPLCGSDGQFYRMYSGKLTDQPADRDHSAPIANEEDRKSSSIKQAIKQVPALSWFLQPFYKAAKRVYLELRHCAGGYRFLRTQDLLIVSGGGQLDEEWGGPWAHPFTLFKWAVLAWIARVPFAIASVGACKITSATSRFFLSVALRMAQYRSYRDQTSRTVATDLMPQTTSDSIVPDMAFSLPSSELPAPAGIRSISDGRSDGRIVVAISPIAFAKPGIWPTPNRDLYNRYLLEMTHVVAHLLERDYFLVIVCSSLGDDERVIPELLDRLDDRSKELAAGQVQVPKIRTWKDLVASLRDADFLIASRLHSTILGFLTQTPTVAISFDSKVDRVMEDLGQTDSLLHIQDFAADDAINALVRIELRRSSVIKQIGSYQHRIHTVCQQQYDTLAGLAGSGQPSHT